MGVLRSRTNKFIGRAGFTLIEVVLLIAVFGLLIAVSAPGMMHALGVGKDRADETQMDFLLSAFLTEQAPFYEAHYNQYDMLNPVFIKEDGSIDAEAALNLYLQDVMDPSKDVYLEGVQCPILGSGIDEDGSSIYTAVSNNENDALWIVCRHDGNRSNAEIRIPQSKAIEYAYSAGDRIRWGDTLLYVGDFENLESRFPSGLCSDYTLESRFHFDNHVHQHGDHKSHIGLVFNYIDDDNFFMIDIELKNGTKKADVYRVEDGNWTMILSKKKLPKLFNVPGNGDFQNAYVFDTQMKVVNSSAGETQVILKMRPEGESYLDVFDETFTVSEDHKTSQYAFYIGEPAGSGFVLKDDSDLEHAVDQTDESTYVYPDVQIQLLDYPTFTCEGEEGGSGGSGTEPEEPSEPTEFQAPVMSYDPDSAWNPITVIGTRSLEYRWIQGLGNRTQPVSGNLTGQSSLDGLVPLDESGWLWAREYEGEDRGEWVSAPWVGEDLHGRERIQHDPSLPESTLRYMGALPSDFLPQLRETNDQWQGYEIQVDASQEIDVQARIVYSGQQVSKTIRYQESASSADITQPQLTINIVIKTKKGVYDGATVTISADERITLSGDASGQVELGDDKLVSVHKKNSSITFTATDDAGNQTIVSGLDVTQNRTVHLP